MQWYYAGKDGQVGPVSAGEFQYLVNNGTIKSTTLVWNSTMTDWQEYSKVGGGSTVRPSAAGGGEKLFCSECGKAFSQDDMIGFGNSWVCASCKPVFVQKLKEGVITSGVGMDYAGFWIRFGAYIIDGIILNVITFFVGIVMGFLGAIIAKSNISGTFIFVMLIYIISFGCAVAYETFFLGKYGATFGKMLCKVKVVTPEGDKITYLRAFGRYFAKILSAIILLIGYIMAAFDDEKRALHDRICDTRVIRQ